MKIAAFVNLENVMRPEQLKENLSNLKAVECFYSDKGNFDLNSLCTGVSARYQDYDYILMLNAPERGQNELLPFYISRQKYYLNGMIAPDGMLDKLLEQMENDHFIGALTLPIDIFQVVNWENVENWEDNFCFIRKWLNQNDLQVSIDKNKPPILNCPVALIRTEAIRGIEEMEYKVYSTQFIAYTISLYCQSRGFLPQYVIPKSMLINNYLGMEGLTTPKNEYSHQINLLMKWQHDRLEILENELESMRQSTSWKITAPMRAIVNMVRGVK